MSITKAKLRALKAAKLVPAADRSRYRVPAPEDPGGPDKVGRRMLTAKQSQSERAERLLRSLGPSLVTVGMAEARAQMPRMVRSSAAGHTYLIRNARTADAPSAVLIGLEEFIRVVAEPVNTRTLGEVLATLPFSGMELQPLTVGALPGSGLPAALLPE